MTSSAQFLRATVAIFALGVAGLSVGHAAARNHDCQAFRMPTGSTLAQHDRAPGPAQRLPN